MYLITVHDHALGVHCTTFTGTFLQAMAEAKRLSLAAHSWVTLTNTTTNLSRMLRHKCADVWTR